MKTYRVDEPSDLVNILIEKNIKEVMIEVIGCFGRCLLEKDDKELVINKHEKQLVVVNSIGEEVSFPIDYIICTTAVTVENEQLKVTIDPTYIIKMLKPEVIKELEQCEVFKKTQEVCYQLKRMKEKIEE